MRFVPAFARACRDPGFGACGLVVGDGRLRDAVGGQIVRHGLEARLRHESYGGDVAPWLACFSLFVLPSRWESLPISVLEAMSAGVLVLATAVGGTSEAVVDGVTGRLVPAWDDDMLARALHEMLTRPEDLERMGKAGRERAARHFTVDRMVAETAMVYESVVSGNPPSAQLTPERWAATVVKSAMTKSRSLRWEHTRAPGAGMPGFRVLFYHRVSDDADLLAVRPREFRRQMAMLADEGFRVVELATAWELLHAGRVPEKVVVLNFDDGYLDFAERAWPVLREHGFPATVFVAPALVDGTSRMSWYRRPPPLLTWSDIRGLNREGVAFEPHSLTHADLTALDAATARREIASSRDVLASRLGRPGQVFCYPGGRAGRRERDLVEQSGMRLAVTCEPGLVEATSDARLLPRIAVGRYDTVRDVRAKAYGGHDRSLPGRSTYHALRYGRRARGWA